MLFDLGGKRRHVVRVVYAILALILASSLFLVVGPFSLSELAGTGSSQNGAAVLEEQAERTEEKLRSNPKDTALLLSLTRTRIAAGNALAEVDPETGEPIPTQEGRAQHALAAEAWKRYLKQTDEPNPAAAALIAGTFFSLAEGSTTYQEINERVKDAAKTQALVAKARPTPNSYSTLAIYEYFNGDFAAGDQARRQAQALLDTKAEKDAVIDQLAPFRKRAKQYRKQARAFEKAQQAQGKEVLQREPLGGLVGDSLTP
jgi:hypothetical protein